MAEQRIDAEIAALTTTVETMRTQLDGTVFPVITELQAQRVKTAEMEKKLETTESLLKQTVDELNARVRPITALWDEAKVKIDKAEKTEETLDRTLKYLNTRVLPIANKWDSMTTSMAFSMTSSTNCTPRTWRSYDAWTRLKLVSNNKNCYKTSRLRRWAYR